MYYASTFIGLVLSLLKLAVKFRFSKVHIISEKATKFEKKNLLITFDVTRFLVVMSKL